METLGETHPGARRLAGGTAFCAAAGVDAGAALSCARAAAGYIERARPCTMLAELRSA